MIRKNYTIRKTTATVMDNIVDQFQAKKSAFTRRCVLRLSVNPTPKELTFFTKHFGKTRRDPGFGGALLPVYWDANELKHLETLKKKYDTPNTSAIVEFAIVRHPYFQELVKKTSCKHDRGEVRFGQMAEERC